MQFLVGALDVTYDVEMSSKPQTQTFLKKNPLRAIQTATSHLQISTDVPTGVHSWGSGLVIPKVPTHRKFNLLTELKKKTKNIYIFQDNTLRSPDIINIFYDSPKNFNF